MDGYYDVRSVQLLPVPLANDACAVAVAVFRADGCKRLADCHAHHRHAYGTLSTPTQLYVP